MRLVLGLFVWVALSIPSCQINAAPRSMAEVAAFKRAHPCPATGNARGACPGYQVDHINPLCAGGADKADNMQWLTIQEHHWKTRSDVRMCALERKRIK